MRNLHSITAFTLGTLLILSIVPTTTAGPLDEPTCDRQEETYSSSEEYHHTIHETCTVKVTDDEICTIYTYDYEYHAYNTGAGGWREVGPYEAETGICVNNPSPIDIGDSPQLAQFLP